MVTRRHHQIFLRCFVSLVNFSHSSKFHVNIITGSSAMTIFFIKNWPEIQKSEIHKPEFFPISEDWGKLWILNLAQEFLIKCYWILQNTRFTAFTVSGLLRLKLLAPPHPPSHRIRIKALISANPPTLPLTE